MTKSERICLSFCCICQAGVFFSGVFSCICKAPLWLQGDQGILEQAQLCPEWKRKSFSPSRIKKETFPVSPSTVSKSMLPCSEPSGYFVKATSCQVLVCHGRLCQITKESRITPAERPAPKQCCTDRKQSCSAVWQQELLLEQVVCSSLTQHWRPHKSLFSIFPALHSIYLLLMR